MVGVRVRGMWLMPWRSVQFALASSYLQGSAWRRPGVPRKARIIDTIHCKFYLSHLPPLGFDRGHFGRPLEATSTWRKHLGDAPETYMGGGSILAVLFNPPVFGGSILAVFLNPTTTLEKQFDRGVFPGGARSPAALVVVSGWFPPVSWLSFLVWWSLMLYH